MASNRSVGMSHSIKSKEDLSSLKMKLSQLEHQLNEYKTKCEGLRRAKATTLIKVEKEYIATDRRISPSEEKDRCDKCEEFQRIIDDEKQLKKHLEKEFEEKTMTKNRNGNPSKKSSENQCDQCQMKEDQLRDERDNLQQAKQSLIEQEKDTFQCRFEKENIEQEIEFVEHQLNDLKDLCQALTLSNEDYQNEMNRMKKEYEEKVEQLRKREDQAKKQISTWEEMYREWMQTMERRVEHLQLTNDQLQNWVDEEQRQFPSSRRSN